LLFPVYLKSLLHLQASLLYNFSVHSAGVAEWQTQRT
jgi:hypothetical protein